MIIDKILPEEWKQSLSAANIQVGWKSKLWSASKMILMKQKKRLMILKSKLTKES